MAAILRQARQRPCQPRWEARRLRPGEEPRAPPQASQRASWAVWRRGPQRAQEPPLEPPLEPPCRWVPRTGYPGAWAVQAALRALAQASVRVLALRKAYG